MYIINTIPHGKCFVRYLRTRCFCIRNRTSERSERVRFLIRQQLVRKYRTPALSMKYSLYILYYCILYLSTQTYSLSVQVYIYIFFFISHTQTITIHYIIFTSTIKYTSVQQMLMHSVVHRSILRYIVIIIYKVPTDFFQIF